MELHAIAPPPQLAQLIQHTLAVRLECDQFHVAATVLPSLILHVRGGFTVAGRFSEAQFRELFLSLPYNS